MSKSTNASASAVSLFKFRENEVRTVEIDGQPWFSAMDVCYAIGLPQQSHGYAVARLDVEQSILYSIQSGRRSQRLISEGGLYKLVLRSDKPEAKVFQNWVTEIVLPAIRKDGGYIQGEEHVATGAISQEEFFRKAIAVMGRKVRATLADDGLWYKLMDIGVMGGIRAERVASYVGAFVRANAPAGSLALRPMKDASGRVQQTMVVNRAGRDVALHYLYGKSKGVNFGAAWARLPNQIDVPVAA
jgi:prophage antirepressor-like protein